jgi:hypothetical protein
MRLNLRTSLSLVLLTTLGVLPACTVHEQSSCEGDNCTGGSGTSGGSGATGGSSAEAGSSSSGGSSAIGSGSATGGAPSSGGTSNTGGKSSSSIGGTTAGSTRTGGTSAINTRTGGAPSSGGSSVRTGGAPSTGGSSARTGGAPSTGGSSARTGGASAVAGSSAVGGSSATGGTASGTDLCPSDPNKTAPGTCGCGIADTDADSDGTADCNDICPSNPQITKPGKITFSVVFTTAAESYPQYLDGLRRSMIAAGNDWATRFQVPHDVSIEVQIDIADIPTANGKSAESVLSETIGGMRLYQQGAAYEILTGEDPNGADPDVEIAFGIDPLSGVDGHYYWSDPDPVTRTATVPNDAVDTVSTCLHELGHALGFNGWRDWSTGELPSPGTYCSYYDYMSSTDGSDFFFDGTFAMAEYGSHVPETYGNLAHIGNLSPHPGQDLDLDLMRGTRTLLAHRYSISDVDLAILTDVGLPIAGTATARSLCTGTPGEPPVVELGPRPVPME